MVLKRKCTDDDQESENENQEVAQNVRECPVLMKVMFS